MPNRSSRGARAWITLGVSVGGAAVLRAPFDGAIVNGVLRRGVDEPTRYGVEFGGILKAPEPFMPAIAG